MSKKAFNGENIEIPLRSELFAVNGVALLEFTNRDPS